MYDSQMVTHEATRVPAVSRLAGCAALAGAALSVAVHAWIGRGVFVPIRLSASVEYVLISATAGAFAWIVLVVAAALAVLHTLVRWLAARHGSQAPLLSWSDISYSRPLWCFSITALSLLNLIRPRIVSLSVLSYVIVDLRWWWTMLVVLWLARSIDARLN